jgi:filamentous hemagglutinin family protein
MRFPLFFRFLLASLSAYSPMLVANPADGQVVGGQADIVQTETLTRITQNTDKAAINWQSFNLASGERVEFVQPNPSSVILNRITGGASDIRGRIDTNGQVILVNNRGLVFGIESQINVGGLLASSLDIVPEDFMVEGGRFAHLTDDVGHIINEGQISALED